MSKSAKQNKSRTDASDASDLDFGALPSEMEAKLTEVDIMASMPCFVPGQEGFTEGMKKAGIYLGTKRVYSNKFNNPKTEKTIVDGKIVERKYRDLHMFRHPTHGNFGIWSVGTLAHVMKGLERGKLICIEYTGLADQPLKPNQAPPHTFIFKGDGVNIDTNSFEDAYADYDRETGEVLNERA